MKIVDVRWLDHILMEGKDFSADRVNRLKMTDMHTIGFLLITRCDGCGKDITGIEELKLTDSTSWKARLSAGLMDELYHFHNKECLKKWLKVKP